MCQPPGAACDCAAPPVWHSRLLLTGGLPLGEHVQDIITDLRLVPTSIDPEGVGDTGATWLRRTPGGAAAEPGPSLEAAVVSKEDKVALWLSTATSLQRCPRAPCLTRLLPPSHLFITLQAALQSKRQELRSSVADGLKGLFAQQAAQQQQKQEQQQQQQKRPTAGGSGGDGDGSDEQIWVHEGFLEAYASVRGVSLRLLDALLAGDGPQEGAQSTRTLSMHDACACTPAPPPVPALPARIALPLQCGLPPTSAHPRVLRPRSRSPTVQGRRSRGRCTSRGTAWAVR